jgi:hypothetical protein
MPEANQDQRSPIDFRPAGAVAGAALPAKSLWDYVRHDYPAYKKLLEAAEDATDIHGNVDLNKVLSKVKPGDYGLSGVQGGGDPFTDALVHGSHASSGGIGAHGQIAGPNVKVKDTISKTPKGEMPPDLTFLKNEAGELHAPALAKNREKFLKEVAKDKADTGNAGTDTYGNMKEKLRAQSKQLAEIKTRAKAWEAYDQSTSNAKPPKGARPSAQEMAKLQDLKGKSVKDFKKFLAKPELPEFFKPKTPTGKADDFLAGIRGDMASAPAEQWATNERKKQRLLDLADRFGAKGTSSDNMRDISTALRGQVDSVGVPGPVPAKSKLFKPKQFETFVPTVLHGGMHRGRHRGNNVIQGMDPVEDFVRNVPIAFTPDRFRKPENRGYGYGFQALRDWAADNIAAIAANRTRAERRPGQMYDHSADNLYRHTINEGSSINPRGYYRDPAIRGPAGRKGTLWMRPKKGIDPKVLEQLVKQEGLKAYTSTNAAIAAIGEITGLSNLAKYVPGFNRTVNTCHGHMCGSFPATVYEAAGNLKNKFPAAITLPNRVAISDAFEPVIATNKQLLLKQLRTGGGRRALMGVGAMGLMGAAGYGATGGAQSAVRSVMPKAAPAHTPVPVPMPPPDAFSKLKTMGGKYAPIAAVGAGSLAALAAAHAWGSSRRKKNPAEELSPEPA